MSFNYARLRSIGRRAFLFAVLLCFPVSAYAVEMAATTQHRDPGDAGVSASANVPETLQFRVVARYPHDRDAYTQGLFWHEGLLYEGTGQKRRSRIRIVEPQTGVVLGETRLTDGRLFGEGIAPLGNRIVSLTWQAGKGFLWSRDSLSYLGEFSYAGEGWGLAATPTGLVMSSGSHHLDFIDSASLDSGRLSLTRCVPVTHDGRLLDDLNELEWIDGAIFANVWKTNTIVRIDPASGVVTGTMDVAALTREAGGNLWDKTPNGIAWDPVKRQLWLTGKYWPTMFVVEFE